MYTKKVLEHFKHPKNVGEIKNADGVGEAGNIICGDVMKIYIKIKEDRIKDIKFQTLGCAAAIATSSIATELAKGKNVKDALKITNNEIIKGLGGLPPIKIHCSLLAIDALKEAIYNYLKKNKLPITTQLEKEHQRISKERKVIKEKQEIVYT